MQHSKVEIGLIGKVARLEADMVEVKALIEILENETFTQNEAARLLNISTNTLVKYKKLGMIAPIDGTTRYTRREITRFLKNRK